MTLFIKSDHKYGNKHIDRTPINKFCKLKLIAEMSDGNFITDRGEKVREKKVACSYYAKQQCFE